ncbi:MAG: VWA domain-containing protein [Polyangiaceae bacterium]|nr:VWA domain-containing protein [Polyangiaceae bacterium]
MRSASIAAALAVVLASSIANGDTFSFTRSDKLVEKEHSVEITLRRDHALIEVERSVYNGGERPDQAIFDIINSTELVATGLRTRGMVDGKPVWFEGELMEAEAAAEKYRELTGVGGYYPKDPALLSWREQGHLALQVFPCMPREVKKVAYTLVAPMTYENGKYVLSVGGMGTEDVVPTGTVKASNGKVTMEGEKPATTFELKDTLRFEQSVPVFGHVHGRLASVPISKDKALAGFHFDVAPRLGEVPDKARIVVLIDRSHSMSDSAKSGSTAAASAYLSQFTGSDVKASVLAFSRDVEQVTKGFAPIAEAKEALADATLDGKNGSELGVALKRAADLLAAAPDGAARRIVLFTDLETRKSLTPEIARKSVAAGTVLHVVTANEGSPSLERDDEDWWATVPRATGGLLWVASATADDDSSKEMSTVFEELARPRRLDHVKLTAPGLEETIEELTLSEGEGIERHLVATRAMTSATLKGELWSKPIEKTLTPDVEYGRLRAALVFGTDLMSGLDEKEMMTLARFGRVVSPVTSYLAIEPGVRPSTEGLEEGFGDGGGGRGEGIGLGSIGTIGHGAGSGTPPDYEGLLREALAKGKKSCDVARATVTAESTLDEIVEVSVTIHDESDAAKKRSCLSEAAWQVRLPIQFATVSHRTTTAKL